MFPYAMLTVANCLAPPTDDVAADTEADVDGPRESNEESQGANAQNHFPSVMLYRTYMNNIFTKYQEKRPGRRMPRFRITKPPNPYPITKQSPLFNLKRKRPTDCTYVVDENLTQFLGWKGDESTSWWKTEQKKCPYWRSPDGTVYRSERDCFRAKYQHDLPPADAPLAGNTTREEDVHDEWDTKQLYSPTNSELEHALENDLAANGGRLGSPELAALQKECGF
jgi:hypothetical protein